VDKALTKPKADLLAPTAPLAQSAGATTQTLTESSVVVSSAKPPAVTKPAAPAVIQPSVPMGPAVAFPNATSSKLIVQGRGLFREGQVLKARERFMAAIVELAPGRVPEVLPDLAHTYDPYYLQQLAKPDVKPNPAMALAIYRRAALSGSKAYEADIQRLEQQRN
jgi:hypothetical protein